MADDVDAGRLVAEVVSDTSGFARDAKKKIDAEVKALKAKIKAEIDSRGLITQARKAAAEASKAAVVRLKVQLDTRGIIGQAQAAAATASKAAVVRIKAEIDSSKLVAEATAAAAAASTAASVDVDVDADTSGAEAHVEEFRRENESKPVRVPVTADGKGLKQAGTALAGLSKAPAIAGGIYLLGAAIVQVGGGLLAVVSAGSQAVGVLSIIPNLVGAVAQGAASLLIGFNGVGNVIGLMGKAEDATTASTAKGGAQAKATARAVQSAMRERERAAQSVKDAQQSLADAQKSADDQAIMGARVVADARQALADARKEADDRQRAAIESVSDAEWALARAQEASADAQKALSDARVAAKKHIDDLNAALKSGALNEKEAALAVDKAVQHLQDVNWSGAASDTDKSEAALQVEQAREHLDEVKKSNKDLAAEAKKANKQGVEGSDQVASARDQVRDALHAEQEDTENLAKAQKDLTDTQVASARSIALAQRALGDAIKENKDGEIAAARAIVQAQRGITEAKQSYADAVQSVADANETAAEGGSKAAAAQTALDAALAKMSPAGQRFAKFIYGLKPAWISLRNDVQAAILPPLENGIRKALPLLGTLDKGLVGSGKVVGGIGEKLGALLGGKAYRNDLGTIMASNNRALALFGDTGLNVIQILTHIGVAAGPLVERFAAWTKTLTAGWLEEVKVGRETGKLQAWLDKAGDRAAQLGSIMKNLGLALFGLGKAAAPAGAELLAEFDKISAKWATFANSDEGQAQMKAFFDATKPVTEEFGRLVVNLLQFITAAGSGGGGSLKGFLDTLNFILGALNKIMAIPGAAPFLGWVMTLAGVGGALGLVSSVFLKMAGNIGKLAKVTGLKKLVDGIRGAGTEGEKTSGVLTRLGTAAKGAGTWMANAARSTGSWIVAQGKAAIATAATTAKLVAQRIASAAMVVWGGLVRVATLAWTAAQWLLNIALSPIGLVVIAIVAAIGLLVLGFIYAWKHSETFRKIVTGALNGIKTAALAVFHAVGDAVGWVVGFIGDHWKLIISILGGPLVAAVVLVTTHWNQIKAIFSTALTWVRDTFAVGWAAVKEFFTHPIDSAKQAIINLLGATGLLGPFIVAINWVKNTFSKGWAIVKDAFTHPIQNAKDGIVTLLGAAGLLKPFSAALDWVKKTFATAWAGLKKMITDPIGSAKTVIETVLGKTGLQKTFTNAVDAVSKIWDGLKAKAKDPIKFIVDTVLNTGLIDSFNWLASKVGVKDAIPHIPLPKGFAGGGFNDGEFSGKIRGRKSNKDNLVARGPLGQRIGLATGEFITKAKETAKNLPLLRAINEGKISSRVSQAIMHGGFADGGIFGGIKNFVTGVASKGKQLGGDVLNILKDPGAWFRSRLASPLDRMKELGSSPYAELVKSVPRKIVDVVANQAKSILTGLGGGGTGPINPGLAGALNWVKTQVGKPYLWGGVGPDGYDCSGLMGAIVNVIKGAEDPFRRLFSTGTLPTNLFEKGPGAFSLGWFKGNPGHTAGTLNGQNVESRGGRGVLVGDKARGANDSLFNSGVWHLKGYAKGGVFGDPPFDLLSPRGKTPLPSSQELMEALGVTFDTGGYVDTGTTVVNNKTGEKEALFQPDTWKAARSVLNAIFAVSRSLRTEGGAGTDAAPLIENLHLTAGSKEDVPELLDEVNHRLRVIKRGGVYADRTP